MKNAHHGDSLFSAAGHLRCTLLFCSMVLTGCTGQVDTPLVMLEQGRMLAERQEFEEAVSVYTKALDGMPENPDVYYLRGVAYENLRLHEKALQDYVKCAELDPARVDALNNKGVVLAKMERFAEAVAEFTRVIELAPEHALALRNRALSRHDLGEDESALTDYARAMELEPQVAVNWFQRGNLYLDLNRFEEAEKDFSKALELAPEFARAWLNRGLTRFRLGQRDAAMEDLHKAESLDDNLVIAGMELLAESSAATPADSMDAPKQPADPVASESPAESQAGHGIPLWPSLRAAAIDFLSQKGFTDLQPTVEIPELNCAVLKGTFQGAEKAVLVTTAFERPATEPQQTERPAESPAAAEPADSDAETGNRIEPDSVKLPGEAMILLDAAVQNSAANPALLVLSGRSGSSEAPRILQFEESWSADDSQISPWILDVRLSRD
jgi:tetratricopeptide (TPR) repeat protein